MKKIIILLGITAFPLMGIAQSTTATNNQNTTFQNRFLGFTNNFPVQMRTGGVTNFHMNQQAGANFLGVPTPGYIGIGADPTDVRSRLTITGTNNTLFGGNGYRPWMQTAT